MEYQKDEIIKFVDEQRKGGRRVGDILQTLGIKRSSFYRWKKEELFPGEVPATINTRRIPQADLSKIDAVKDKNPEYRHRRVQAEIQKGGTYISPTSVYRYMKSKNLVEPYQRRESPWKHARYEVIRRDTMWGSDWTKLRIDGVRWYLLTIIDFFSRLIVAFKIVPTVNAAFIKAIYLEGLANEGIPKDWHLKPELRVDRGSPNTSGVTKAFFKDMDAELSLARVRRPTDNAITERFYGTIKQEEIYVVGNYPDFQAAQEEIGKYIRFYNAERPHQSLWNFTPGYIHELNDKSEALRILKELKRKTFQDRKYYWMKSDLQKNELLSH